MKCQEAWDTIRLLEQNRFKFVQLGRLWRTLPFAKWDVARDISVMLS